MPCRRRRRPSRPIRNLSPKSPTWRAKRKAVAAILEAAKADLHEIEHDIRERLRAKGARRVEGDGVSVVWSPVKGRPSYDMKGIREAAEKAGLDLAECETVGEPTDRLVIRVAGQSRSAA